MIRPEVSTSALHNHTLTYFATLHSLTYSLSHEITASVSGSPLRPVRPYACTTHANFLIIRAISEVDLVSYRPSLKQVHLFSLFSCSRNIKCLSDVQIAQVACGYRHSHALSKGRDGLHS